MENRYKILLILIAALFIAGGLYFLYFNRADYVIPGVPYFGFYNHYFDANATFVTSIADILGYWGDKRFSLDYLMERFGPVPEQNNFLVPATLRTTLGMEQFFKSIGYDTYRWVSDDPGEEIQKIKEFVNQEKKIPVIVYQKRSTDQNRMVKGTRVVIGILDRQKKIVAHDHDFGNNYTISYEDFLKMFQSDARAILAVWPSDDLAAKISGPDGEFKYPKRMEAMDQVGELLVKSADALAFHRQKEYQKSAALMQEFVADEKFGDFPPAHRVKFYTFLAWLNLYLGDYDAVIGIVNNKILPINNNLSQPFGEWTEQVGFFKEQKFSEDKMETPYAVLARAYNLKGNNELARKNFEEALRINPYAEEIRAIFEKLKSQNKI